MLVNNTLDASIINSLDRHIPDIYDNCFLLFMDIMAIKGPGKESSACILVTLFWGMKFIRFYSK